MALGPITDEMGLGSLVAQAAEDAKELVRAEIELAKARIAAKVAGARNAIILLVVAVFLFQAALTTLLVGCALELARWVGPLGGATIVMVVTLIVIAVLARIAIGQLAGKAEPATGAKS